MANNTGWISLHRQVQSHWIWKDPQKFQWWVDILLTVNNSDIKVNIGFEIFDCKKGESLMSIQSWAARWGVSKDTARNFLKLLEKDKMITCVSIGKSTRLTVCNYVSYQNTLHVKQTLTHRQPTATSPLPHTNNNDNNEDNDNKKNKVFIPPSESDVRSHFLENGFREDIGTKAFSYYDRLAWKDSKGKQVKDWKRKMVSVWFTEENKIAPTEIRKLVY